MPPTRGRHAAEWKNIRRCSDFANRADPTFLRARHRIGWAELDWSAGVWIDEAGAMRDKGIPA